MSQENIILLTAVISSLAAIIGVVIGSVVSYFIARQQFRATVLSANRQQWINTLRDCIADFQTKAKIAIVEANLAEHDQTSVAANVKNHYEALETMRFIANKVALLLNPNEADHSELISLLKKLEDLCINGGPSDWKNEGKLQDSITSTGQRILKREWERVKRGK
ncbi:MAG: hypothetical protein Q7T53_03420 [Deltaproteobacteria bacterium]|nr:hypothetical protein [Deltaproteobacteria bacterium]